MNSSVIWSYLRFNAVTNGCKISLVSATTANGQMFLRITVPCCANEEEKAGKKSLLFSTMMSSMSIRLSMFLPVISNTENLTVLDKQSMLLLLHVHGNFYEKRLADVLLFFLKLPAIVVYFCFSAVSMAPAARGHFRSPKNHFYTAEKRVKTGVIWWYF